MESRRGGQGHTVVVEEIENSVHGPARHRMSGRLGEDLSEGFLVDFLSRVATQAFQHDICTRQMQHPLKHTMAKTGSR